MDGVIAASSSSAASSASPVDTALPLFARGVIDLLASWPALRLAVTHGWSAKSNSSAQRSSAAAQSSSSFGEAVETEPTNNASLPSETTSQKRIRMAEEIVDAFYTRASESSSSSSSMSASFNDQMEDFLLDFFEYEYGVGLEDGSEMGVVRDLSKLWEECVTNGRQIDGGLLEKFARMAEKAAKEDGDPRTAFRGTRTGQNGGDDDDYEDDDSSSESDDEDGSRPHIHTHAANGDGMDVDDDEAPQLIRTQKEEPQVDEDGFTMVSAKTKRRGH